MSLPRTIGLLLLAILALAAPLRADSKAETMKPPPQAAQPPSETALEAEVEAKYRKALEERMAKEKASYEGSLTSLWLSNAAVWAVLLAFIVMQALSARKRAAELERLRAAREGGQS